MNKQQYNYNFHVGKEARLSLLKLLAYRLKGVPISDEAIERAEKAVLR